MYQNSLKPYLVISTAMIMLSTVANATSTDIENFKSEAEQSSGQSPIVVTIDMASVSENDNVVSQSPICVEVAKIESDADEAPKKESWSFWWQTKEKPKLEIADQTKDPLATLPSIEKVDDKYPFGKTVVIRRIGYLGGWLLGIGSDVVEISENEYNDKEFFDQHYPGYELVMPKQEIKEVPQDQNSLPTTEPTVTIKNSNNSISFKLDSMEKGTEQTSREVAKSEPAINFEILKEIISVDEQQATPVNVIESIK